MLSSPTTLAEARAHRYGVWGGNRWGTSYQDGHCIAEVPDDNPRSPIFHQCRRKCGPDGYCYQHRPKPAK